MGLPVDVSRSAIYGCVISRLESTSGDSPRVSSPPSSIRQSALEKYASVCAVVFPRKSVFVSRARGARGGQVFLVARIVIRPSDHAPPRNYLLHRAVCKHRSRATQTRCVRAYPDDANVKQFQLGRVCGCDAIGMASRSS